MHSLLHLSYNDKPYLGDCSSSLVAEVHLGRI